MNIQGYSELREPIRTRENRLSTDFVNTNKDYRQKKQQKPRSPGDQVASAPFFWQSWRKWRKISHFLWKFFLRIFESVQICRHFGTPFAEHEDSNCSSGVFQYWSSLMNCRKEKILQDKIFENPLVHDPKFKKNAKFHALFKVLNTNSLGVRAHRLSLEILHSPSWQDWLDFPNSRQESKGKCKLTWKKFISWELATV